MLWLSEELHLLAPLALLFILAIERGLTRDMQRMWDFVFLCFSCPFENISYMHEISLIIM